MTSRLRPRPGSRQPRSCHGRGRRSRRSQQGSKLTRSFGLRLRPTSSPHSRQPGTSSTRAICRRSKTGCPQAKTVSSRGFPAQPGDGSHTLPCVGACGRCGRENPPEAVFCMACAARLEAELRPEARKPVSILFNDIAGYTSFAERFEPEMVRRVMSSYFEAVSEVCRRHGGTVEKFIGDAAMAVFGIPVAFEDHALRAVRAAVELNAALAPLNDALERDWGVRLSTRTGVNSGEVVAGDPAGGS